jgi:hypothetical protein
VLLKTIYVVLASLAGFAAITSLWGMVFWHWEGTRLLPQAEIEAASHESHVWFFWLIVSGVAGMLFSILAARTSVRN